MFGQNVNLPQMMQAFGQFRNNYKGNPSAELQQLLQSGKMTQQQYEQLRNMAEQFSRMLPH
jgi:tRNA C32,U32 (ribose-2'-O)-methylase TrmJ